VTSGVVRVDGLRRTAWKGLKQGAVVAVAYTGVTLLLDEDAAIWLWGTAMILGPVLVLLGVAFWAVARFIMRLDARWSLDTSVQDPYLFMLRTERALLRSGLALVVSWLVLSAALLLRGETLL
jgi:hypothetical protein